VFRLSLTSDPDSISACLNGLKSIFSVGDASNDHSLSKVALQFLDHRELKSARLNRISLLEARNAQTGSSRVGVATVNDNRKIR